MGNWEREKTKLDAIEGWIHLMLKALGIDKGSSFVIEEGEFEFDYKTDSVKLSFLEVFVGDRILKAKNVIWKLTERRSCSLYLIPKIVESPMSFPNSFTTRAVFGCGAGKNWFLMAEVLKEGDKLVVNKTPEKKVYLKDAVRE